MAGPESWPHASSTSGEQGDVVAVVAVLEGVGGGSAAAVRGCGGFCVLGDEAGDLGARQAGDLLDVPPGPEPLPGSESRWWYSNSTSVRVDEVAGAGALGDLDIGLVGAGQEVPDLPLGCESRWF